MMKLLRALLKWFVTEMDLESILLIFKVSCLFIFLSLMGCSHTKEQPTHLPSTSKVTHPLPIDLGPSIYSSYFEDRTYDYGLDHLKATSLYAVDLNLDKYTDLVILPDLFSAPQFYLFNPKIKKFEKLDYNVFSESFLASYLIFSDINNDGITDLFLGVFNQEDKGLNLPTRFFWGKINNEKITFVEDSKVFVNQPRATASLSLFDFDLDGDLDIYQANWAQKKKNLNSPDLLDHLYEQIKDDKGKTYFSDVTPLLKSESEFNSSENIYLNARPTSSSTICDIDNNGFPDILTTVTHGQGNKLWMNRSDKSGGRFFVNLGKESNFESDDIGKFLTKGGGFSLFSTCADYNHDQQFDIFVGNSFHHYDLESADRSTILESVSQANSIPKFIRHELSVADYEENWDRSDQRGIWIDLDHDGEKDLLVANSGQPPHTRLLFYHQVDGKFVEQSKQYGIDILNPRGTILMDINRDGKPDVITGQTNQRTIQSTPRIYVFENHIPVNLGKTFFKVHLQGQHSNIKGIGATVVLKTNKSKKKQYAIWSEGGPPSQTEEILYYSLEKNEQPISFEVTWPYLKNHSATTPLLVNYPLKKIAQKLKSKKVWDLVLCESGQIYFGKESKTTCTN